MMQIFVRNPQGNTTTLNVEKNETICSVKRRFKEKEGISSDLHLGLIYKGKLLDDGHTVAHSNILNHSTLHLFLSQHTLAETWEQYVQIKSQKDTRFSLKVKSVDTIDDVKAKIQEIKGIPPPDQLLFDSCGKWLQDGSRTLADYDIHKFEILRLAIQFQQGPKPNVTSQGKPATQIAPRQTKRPRPPIQTTPDSNTHSISDPGDGEATELEDLKREMVSARSKKKELEATISGLTEKNNTFSAQLAAMKDENKKIKEELTVVRRKEKEQETTISGLTEKSNTFSAQIVAMKDENKKIKEELTAVRSKEKEQETTISGPTQKNNSFSAQVVAMKAESKKIKNELPVVCGKEKEQEATITGLTQKNKLLSDQCGSYENQIIALKAENKNTAKELTVARNKEMELEAIVSELTYKNKVFSDLPRSYESQNDALKAENKKVNEELTVARNKEKELEVTIRGLRHKNKVFLAQCSSYESQVVALEAECKKTKEELMNAEKKLYSGARAAGYSEGLKEGKAKWLKSVEFLRHLTDASVQYFDYGFDSCQKQAEQQGFVGRLNKNAALKDAPEPKGWESGDQSPIRGP